MNNKLILILLTVTSLSKMELPFWLQKPKAVSCDRYNSQLIGLFTVMCNNIANGEDDVLRDACVGCFQQASTVNNNQPSLTEMRNCANSYLTDTRYDGCPSQIDSASSSSGGCVTGYCQFVTCIRRTNSDLLIAQCYEQASQDNDAIFEDDQVTLVKNISSCILARTRCANINPLTGQQQSSVLTTTKYDKWGKQRTTTTPLYNALQITPGGDLRIVRLPGTTKIQDYFCTAQPNLQESTWLGFSC